MTYVSKSVKMALPKSARNISLHYFQEAILSVNIEQGFSEKVAVLLFERHVRWHFCSWDKDVGTLEVDDLRIHAIS